MDPKELIRKLMAQSAEKRQQLVLLHETAEAEDRPLTADEQKTWDATKVEMAALDRRQQMAEEAARMKATTATPVEPDNVRITAGHDNAEDAPFHQDPKLGFAHFMRAVHQACPQVSDVIDPRLRKLAAPSGTNEGVPSEGGFLLEPALSVYISTLAFDSTQLAGRCFPIEVGEGRNSAVIKCIDETSRVTGSRFGGVQAYWAAEAGNITATKPKWRAEDVKLQKIMGLWYVTDEELQDVAWLASVGPFAFGEEIGWELDYAIALGNGVGKPLGYRNSGAMVTVAKEAGQPADTIEYKNVANMFSRLAPRSIPRSIWIANQDCYPALQTMLMPGFTGQAVFLPPTGAAGAPYGTLMGRPILLAEFNPTLGDQGDLQLVDLGWYALVRKGGMAAAASIHVRFIYEETAFRFSQRVNGIPMLSSPITPASGSANTISPFVQLAERA